MSDEEELEALRQQTDRGDRIDTATDAADQQAFVDDIVAELEAIEAGDQQKTVSVWDGHLAAFLRALEENPDRMTEVGQNLQRRLDIDEGEIDRSAVLRFALRLGFREAAPETFEAVREAARTHATKGL
jgi:hypothetical protein